MDDEIAEHRRLVHHHPEALVVRRLVCGDTGGALSRRLFHDARTQGGGLFLRQRIGDDGVAVSFEIARNLFAVTRGAREGAAVYVDYSHTAIMAQTTGGFKLSDAAEVYGRVVTPAETVFLHSHQPLFADEQEICRDRFQRCRTREIS
jgi:hypothetical protein